jgi:hypothetical protein
MLSFSGARRATTRGVMRFVGTSLTVASLAVASAGHAQSATFLGYSTTVSKAWASATPSSSMRLAQYTIAGAPGTLPVEVVVYFFGPGQGGDPAANLERWHSQFSNPDGTPVKEVVTHEKSAFPITFAEYRGTYARGVGAGSSAADARPNHLLMAAIAETPKGSLFVQCYGPAAATEAQRAAFRAFVLGLK